MFNNAFKDKKVLITGNTGFKGSWLSLWLLKLGAEVYGMSKDVPTSPAMFEELGLAAKIVHYEKDIRQLDEVRRIIQEVRPDFLFHLAAQPIVSRSYADPLETISSNVVGTANILEALRMVAHPCVAIIITSDKCYDNVEWEWGYRENDQLGGKDIYSGSKGAAELIFRSYYHSFFKGSDKVRVASVRAGNVIGGGDWGADRIVPDCMRAWSKGLSVDIRNPQATRPWQHVLEPLSGYLTLAWALMDNERLSGESFNFGPRSEQSQSVVRLLQDLAGLWHFNEEKSPYKIAEKTSFHEAGLLKLNCDKALFHLNWLSTLDYKELIDFTGRWYVAFYEGGQDMVGFSLQQIDVYEQLAADKRIAWAK